MIIVGGCCWSNLSVEFQSGLCMCPGTGWIISRLRSRRKNDTTLAMEHFFSWTWLQHQSSWFWWVRLWLRSFPFHGSGSSFCQGWIQGGDWGDRPPKTYESNFSHHVLYNSERHLTANWNLTAKYYWNRPLNLRAGSTPGFCSFSHINILIVMVCLKLNGKWIKSSAQN